MSYHFYPDDADRDEPEVVVEETKERLYFAAGLTHKAYWTDKPGEVAYGYDADNARDHLDITYPRSAS